MSADRSPKKDGSSEVDVDLVRYVIGYYGHLMTPDECKAQGHLYATMKATNGRSDAAAQEESRTSSFSQWQSSDEDVLRLASEGYEAFVERTAKRILAEHRPEIFLNNCPVVGDSRKLLRLGSAAFAITIGTKLEKRLLPSSCYRR
jgi:hypothetical protein